MYRTKACTSQSCTYSSLPAICSVVEPMKFYTPPRLVGREALWGSGAVRGGTVKPDVDVLFAQTGQLRSQGLSCYICSRPQSKCLTEIKRGLSEIWKRKKTTWLWGQIGRKHGSVFMSFSRKKGPQTEIADVCVYCTQSRISVQFNSCILCSLAFCSNTGTAYVCTKCVLQVSMDYCYSSCIVPHLQPNPIEMLSQIQFDDLKY